MADWLHKPIQPAASLKMVSFGQKKFSKFVSNIRNQKYAETDAKTEKNLLWTMENFPSDAIY